MTASKKNKKTALPKSGNKKEATLLNPSSLAEDTIKTIIERVQSGMLISKEFWLTQIGELIRKDREEMLRAVEKKVRQAGGKGKVLEAIRAVRDDALSI